jgi:hypothetical protein
MRKTIILVSAAVLTASTLSLAGAAFARTGDRSDRTPQTRADVETSVNEAFSRLDVNGDGVLSKADREAKERERFAKSDSDGNGQLSFEEVTAARDAGREALRERFGEGRGDRQRGARMGEGRGKDRGDRQRGKGSKMGRSGGQGLRSLAGIVRSADADGDQQISQAEFSSAALARFDRADADGDGTISREERDALRGAGRPKRARSGE